MEEGEIGDAMGGLGGMGMGDGRWATRQKPVVIQQQWCVVESSKINNSNRTKNW